MKSLLLIFTASFLLAASTPPADKNVYLCNGSASKKYHLKTDCSGLNRCSTSLEKVTEKEAIKRGRTMCKIED